MMMTWLGEVRGLRMRWLVVLGQTALVLYFVHQIIAYTVVKQALGIEFKSWTAYWLANIALMVGLLAFSQLWLVVSARLRAWRTTRAATTEPATTEATR